MGAVGYVLSTTAGAVVAVPGTHCYKLSSHTSATYGSVYVVSAYGSVYEVSAYGSTYGSVVAGAPGTHYYKLSSQTSGTYGSVYVVSTGTTGSATAAGLYYHVWFSSSQTYSSSHELVVAGSV
jgi:hypothetical protein